jgi:hypothetical protein
MDKEEKGVHSEEAVEEKTPIPTCAEAAAGFCPMAPDDVKRELLSWII